MVDQRPSVDEALARIWAEAGPLGTERLPLDLALDRRLAEAVTATVDVPRFVAAAMDGYAVSSADCLGATASKPVVVSIDSVVAAGGWPPALAAGAAAPISTGAPMPAGADAIIVREDARLVGDCLAVTTSPRKFANVRAIGEDMAVGRVVAPQGMRITADVIGALMASGVNVVAVQRLPTIRLFTTGSELAPDIGGLGNPAMIIDSNGPMIKAFAISLGLSVEFAGRASDEGAALDIMLETTPDRPGEIVISTGGVSHGSFDLVRERLERAGATIHFHGVRMRPGKPLLFATLADGRLYFGLPGTPVAALVAMRFFVMAAIRAMARLEPEAGVGYQDGPPARPATTLFLRGHASQGLDGKAVFEASADQRSHVLSSVLPANAWLRVEADKSLIFPKLPDYLS